MTDLVFEDFSVQICCNIIGMHQFIFLLVYTCMLYNAYQYNIRMHEMQNFTSTLYITKHTLY